MGPEEWAHWVWLGAGIVSALTLIVLIGNAIDRIVKFWKAFKAPNDEMRRELNEMKEWRKEFEADGPAKEWRKNVDKKLDEAASAAKSQDSAHRVLFQSLIALLDHGIDGNNVEQMENAKNALNTYLIDK